MIILIRDNECFEPRVKNYIGYFNRHNIDYKIIAWNRNGLAEQDEHIVFYEKRAEYGKRILNIPKKIGWMLFVVKTLFSNIGNCDMIHACDIDAILPALMVAKLTKKPVVFDIFDWIESLTGKGVVYKIVNLLQNFCYKHSDAVILCEEERKNQATAENENILIIPNIPDAKFDFDEDALAKTASDTEAYDLVVSYVGVFDRDRGLENLLSVVSENPDVKLNIAGFGVLQDMITDYADKFKNISYWGRVDYNVGQAIQKNSDMIAAMYHLTSPLHKYAAPNKYYESLFLGVPMITTVDTLVGSKVHRYDTGFVIGESKEALAELLARRKSEMDNELAKKKNNCISTWEGIYKNYYEEYMTGKYLELVNK